MSTPRTDAEVAPWIDRAPDAGELRSLIDLTGDLERENARLREALEAAVDLMVQEDFATLSLVPKLRAALKGE